MIHNYINAYKKGGIPGLEGGARQAIEIICGPTRSAKRNHCVPDTERLEIPWPLQPAPAPSDAVYSSGMGRLYTLKGASELLHSFWLSYTRPTYMLLQADSAKKQTFF